MELLLAALAVVMSVVPLGWIGLRDPKRVHAQERDAARARAPLEKLSRRLLALGALLPGVALLVAGWWSSTALWLGTTVTLMWLWVLWLARPRHASKPRTG